MKKIGSAGQAAGKLVVQRGRWWRRYVVQEEAVKTISRGKVVSNDEVKITTTVNPRLRREE